MKSKKKGSLSTSKPYKNIKNRLGKNKQPEYLFKSYSVFTGLVSFELYENGECFAAFPGAENLVNDRDELLKIINAALQAAGKGRRVLWAR